MAEQAEATTPAQSPSEPPVTPPGEPKGGAPEGRRIVGLTRNQLLGLLAAVVVAQLPFIGYLTRGQAPVTVRSLPFADDFNRAQIGDNYFTTGGHWRIEDGVLHSPGVKNNPLWIKAKLPDEVAVEFDAKSESADGDIKAEIFGNGRDHSSGYVIIFGGWSNSVSITARLDEHGRNRKETRALKVEKGRWYHIRIERRGTVLRWLVDNQLMVEYDDPASLRGKGHDRFGFSSWDSDIYFDNLRISAL